MRYHEPAFGAVLEGLPTVTQLNLDHERSLYLRDRCAAWIGWAMEDPSHNFALFGGDYNAVHTVNHFRNRSGGNTYIDVGLVGISGGLRLRHSPGYPERPLDEIVRTNGDEIAFFCDLTPSYPGATQLTPEDRFNAIWDRIQRHMFSHFDDCLTAALQCHQRTLHFLGTGLSIGGALWQRREGNPMTADELIVAVDESMLVAKQALKQRQLERFEEGLGPEEVQRYHKAMAMMLEAHAILGDLAYIDPQILSMGFRL